MSRVYILFWFCSVLLQFPCVSCSYFSVSPIPTGSIRKTQKARERLWYLFHKVLTDGCELQLFIFSCIEKCKIKAGAEPTPDGWTGANLVVGSMKGNVSLFVIVLTLYA